MERGREEYYKRVQALGARWFCVEELCGLEHLRGSVRMHEDTRTYTPNGKSDCLREAGWW